MLADLDLCTKFFSSTSLKFSIGFRSGPNEANAFWYCRLEISPGLFYSFQLWKGLTQRLDDSCSKLTIFFGHLITVSSDHSPAISTTMPRLVCSLVCFWIAQNIVISFFLNHVCLFPRIRHFPTRTKTGDESIRVIIFFLITLNELPYETLSAWSFFSKTLLNLRVCVCLCVLCI